MRTTQIHILESLHRVRDFVQSLPPERTPPNVAGPATTLGEVLDRIGALAATQETGTRAVQGDAKQIRALRRTLRVGHMRPIAQVARALLGDVPGVEDRLRLPARTVDSRTLLAAADSMGRAAEPHLALLVRSGLPDDVLTQLRAAAAALAAGLTDRARTAGDRAGATAGVRRELARGRRAVLLLDAAMQRAYHDDPAMLARWRSAKRVQVAASPAVESPAASPEATQAA